MPAGKRQTGKRGARYGKCLKFLEGLISSNTDKCIRWPFGLNADGYGQIKFRGTSRIASQVMLILVTGEKPLGLECAHSCGNRICVNPRHLRFATPVENQADRLIHGTDNRGEKCVTAKLTETQVLEIYASSELQSVLAKNFGVCRSNISLIKAGKSWSWLTGN